MIKHTGSGRPALSEVEGQYVLSEVEGQYVLSEVEGDSPGVESISWRKEVKQMARKVGKKRATKAKVSKEKITKLSKQEYLLKDFTRESYFSMALGLLVVIGLGFLIFNTLFKRAKEIEPPTERETKVEEEVTEEVSPTSEITGETYTVRPGDSLLKIALWAYGDKDAWVKIAEANNIRNPNHIEPGTILRLPR